MMFFRRRAAGFGAFAGLLVVCMCLAAAVALSSGSTRDATAAVTALPTEIPRRDLPKVKDGTVFSGAQVGEWIVVGGDFTEIELRDGNWIDQNAVFAYHVDTGELNTDFLPDVQKVSGPAVVLSITPAVDGSSVYLAGKFGTVDGIAQARVVKISVDTGVVDTSFDPVVNAPVRDLELHDGNLYLGGEFTMVDGQPRNRLAKVDALDGDVDSNFIFDITGSTRGPGEPYGPKHVSVVDDDTLVVAHRARFVNGTPRTGVALIDIESNTLRDWSTDFWGANSVTTVDGDVAPDGSYLVVVGDGGDFPFMGRDSAVAFSLVDDEVPNQDPMWISRTFDSAYAVGITDEAVFIGGHFCWVESELAPDPWPGDGEFTNNNSCHGTSPASRFAPHVVYRDQIAAIDPVNGHAMLWDPGSDALQGVQAIDVVERGLLIGHDGDRFGRDLANSRSWNVGRHAFLDLNSAPGPDTSQFIDQPVVGLCGGLTPTVTGTTRADVLIGTDGDDVILAGPGNDVVYGGRGDDIICGNAGSDSLYGDRGNDEIHGGDGRDRIFGGRGDDELRGDDGRDILTGELGDDLLFGGKKFDRLNGRNGSDVLKGNGGPDRLAGGPLADTLIGGAGVDQCAGDALGGSPNPGDQFTTCES